MPLVTATPRGQNNGQVITEFIDSVGTSSVTYTYPKTQESLSVRNIGTKAITVTVGGTSQAIQPGQKWDNTADFTSFSIVSSSGVQAFEATTDEKGSVFSSPEGRYITSLSGGGGGSRDMLKYSNENVTRATAVSLDQTIVKQDYLGGYIEIQPDSYDGTVPATDATTKTWGFPTSLLPTEKERIKEFAFKGNSILYIRIPLGFAYRGYRNIDGTSGLAKNIGERFAGQNAALKSWFDKITLAGGGLSPEYWCPPPYWVTSGSYNGNNQLRAGGSYPLATTLASIKATDVTQYNATIAAFTDAIINDLEYLHQNIAPVRMFGLQNEPTYSQQTYGACKYDAQTYNDVLEVLYPKIQANVVLSVYNGASNTVKLHVASNDESPNPFSGIPGIFIANHPNWIWGYSHHHITYASGEIGYGGADWYKTPAFTSIKGTKSNVFLNEYEYFSTSFGTNDFRCSNNMLHLIGEAVYGEAQVLHPIIHICKPLGQALSTTNTTGYCLFAVNLSGSYGLDASDPLNTYGLNRGAVTPNVWAYNSWAMFADNLPVGAYRVGDCTTQFRGAGWCAYKYNGKLYLFLANNTGNDVSISVSFGASKTFTGRAYSMKYCGDAISDKTGEPIEFVIPAYSGQVWIEPDVAPIVAPFVAAIVPSGTTLISDTVNRANNAMTTGFADVGGAWLLDQGGSTFEILNGWIHPIAATITLNTTAYFDTKHANATVSVDGIYGGYLALSIRYVDASNYLRLRISSSGLGLFTFINNVATSIGTYSVTPVVGNTYNLKVTMNGDTIQCYLNGTLVITASTAQFNTATKHGIYVDMTNGLTAYYKNFLVKSV